MSDAVNTRSIAAQALDAWGRLERLRAHELSTRQDYEGALRGYRDTTKRALSWLSQPQDQQARERFLSSLDDLGTAIRWRGSRHGAWKIAKDALDQFPYRTFDDCMVGLRFADLREAAALCEQWMISIYHHNRREQDAKQRFWGDAARRCLARTQKPRSAITPAGYVKAMNDALGLGPKVH